MNNDVKRDELLERIKAIESQVISLSEEKKKLIHELNTSLQQNSNIVYPDISRSQNNVSYVKDNISEFSMAEKIKLFSNLFRGRQDVYARFWKNKKTGKSGYIPVCKNEWIQGICKRPMMKCSECPNRELSLLTEDVIHKHLQGEYIIGIYPMLADETCHFLAADFDGEGWLENVFAFKKTCIEQTVPVAIERSRSGNGAHVWIFFEEKVPASVARKMGSFLLTETMSKRYQLDMKSYDRLFPNQDTLPKGGFGNLIALPFQKEAMTRGNSVFIDDSGAPHDQWKFLSCLKKMSLSDVEKISKKDSTSNKIKGVEVTLIAENEPPWMKLPSGKKRYKPLIDNLPDEIEIVIANRIYIKTDNLPSMLLNQIKQLAVFQNPEFYRRQSMRLSTSLTPKVISCYEISDEYLSIPRGCISNLCSLMDKYGIKVTLKDERFLGKRINYKFCGILNKEQEISVNKILEKDIGMLVTPSGVGKTVIAIYTIAKRKTNTLILVHRKHLMEQWRMRLVLFLNIDIKDIGQIGAGKNAPNGFLDIATIQSMRRKDIVDDRIVDYGFIIVDECHHIPAFSFEKILAQAKAKYVLGLTATPYRRDGHHPIIYMQCGTICYRAKEKDINQQIYSFLVVPRITKFIYEWSEDININDIWQKLINDEERNKIIVDDIVKVIQSGRFPIILTERREHLDILVQKLQVVVEHLVILHGGLKSKELKEKLNELSKFSFDKNKAILATGSYVGEGFDVPMLDTLFITMPISFKGKIIQYAGRLHRRYQGKKEVCIYDYVDQNVPILAKMYQNRLKTYKIMGYKIQQEVIIPE